MDAKAFVSMLALALAATGLALVGADPGTGHAISPIDTPARPLPAAYDKPREAAEFFEAQRRPIDGSDVDMAAYFTALEDVRARQRAQARERSATGPGGVVAWSPLGPGNLGGRTRTLVFDPTDPDTMYTAGVSGGVWKSTDAGASWDALDDTMANLAVTTIVIDPTDPDTLYAGTGEGFFPGSGPAGRGFGIFKTTDAGATWTQLPNTASGLFYYVNRLAISPNDPRRIYAATRTGVWLSPDAGDSWDLVLANPGAVSAPGVQQTNGCIVGCTDLVVRSDRNPDVIFAAFGSWQSDGLYRSDNGGETWIQYTVPSQQGRMELALAPSDNDILYLCMADNGSGSQIGRLVQLFRSDDGGSTFTPQVDLANDALGPELLSNMFVAFGCVEYTPYSQGWYDLALAVDPVDPDVVWVGGIDLCRSDDGGVTWGRPSYYRVPAGHPAYVHADLHGVFYHPDYDGAGNTTVYATSDGGLYRTDNALDATTTVLCPDIETGPNPDVTWVSLNNGYEVTQFYHGDTSPLVDLFIGGAQDNGTNAGRTADPADDWDHIFGGDGGYVAIDPTDPDVIYVEIQNFPEIRKSTDGGATFVDAVAGITDTDGLFITPFAMDPSDPETLWTGGSRPWRTTNGAALWELARPFPFPDGGKISAIAVAPSDSNVVYLGLSNGRVFRSTNALDPNPSWTESSNLNGLINGAYVSSVAVHPTDPGTAYLTYSNYGIPHVFRTTDGGLSWSPLDGAAPDTIPDVPAHWIAVRPSNPDQLYVATELGVLASDDAGATWKPTGLGIPNTIVESLDFQTDDALVAFTHGRGAFRAALAPTPSPCAGDVNGDGTTDVFDFAELSANFGAGPGATREQGDLTGDGVVDVFDFSELAADFGCAG
jgi:photosystem II stability/assembly factor-like uncharacterized protein